MQVVDANGNVFGQGLEITGIDGKPKVPIINTDITIGTTVINGGVSGRLLFDDAGVVGETNGVHWDKVNSRFGIGTTTPLFPLDILGTAKFASATSGIIIRDWTAFNTYRAIYKASETPSDLNYLLAMDQDVLINSRGSGTDIRFNGAIRARFGNAFSLRVIGSGNTTATVGFEAANSSSTPLLQVRDNGVVLIGTTTDAGYKLDVNGTARINSSLYVSDPAFAGQGRFYQAADNTTVIVGRTAGASENITFGPSNRIFINAGQTWASQTFLIGGASSVGAISNPGIFSAIHLITGTSTAASAIARAQYINTTLVQSVANDVLTAVQITPTFTVNNTLFHDVYWMRFTGSYAPASFTGNNNAATIDLSNSFTNANNAIGIRIRHTYSNVQNGYGILIESPSFIGIAQTSLTSINFLAGTTVIGSSVVAPATGYTLHVTNNTNGAIKVGSASQANEHLVISHSQAGSTFSSIRNTFAATGATMLIDVAGQNNLRLFGTGNVAINTTTDAGFKLDVNGKLRAIGADYGVFLGFNVDVQNVLIANALYIRSGSNTLGGLFPYSTGTGGIQLQSASSQPIIRGAFNEDTTIFPARNDVNNLGDVVIQGGGSERARFKANGNVGIGTSSPLDFNLVVQGVQQIRASASSFGGLRLDATSIRRRDTGTFSLGTNDSSTAINMFAPTNNVGINTATDAGYKLDVNGTARVSGQTFIQSAAGAVGLIADFGQTNSRIQFESHGSNDFTQIKIGNNFSLSRNGGSNPSISTTLNFDFKVAQINFSSLGNAPSRIFISGNYGLGSAYFGANNSNGTTVSTLYFQNSVTPLAVQNVIATFNIWGMSDNATVPTTPASSMFALESTTRGFLPPRMTNAQMLAIATPAAGLIVYDTTNNKHYGYDGTTWNPFY
jgi:hypothetical protein